jgi:adenine-specific DNA-methyltransferase
MSNFDALVAKLREIFQIDRPDLDFGVYRILNARAGRDRGLPGQAAEGAGGRSALASRSCGQYRNAEGDIAKAEKAAEEAGISADPSRPRSKTCAPSLPPPARARPSMRTRSSRTC